MALVVTTAPIAEPLSVSECKAHLRIEHSEEDTLIESYLKAARQYVEAALNRSLINTTWKETWDCFPAIMRPSLAKVQSVTSIQYVDVDGTLQTLASSRYQTDLDGEPARIWPAYTDYWPASRSDLNAVRLTYVVGYGASPTSVPECLKTAIRLLVGHWYENREPIVTGTIATPLGLTIESLIAPERWGVYR